MIKLLLDKLAAFQGAAPWGRVLDIIGDSVQTVIPETELRQWVYRFPAIRPETLRSLNNMSAVWKSPYACVKEEELRQALAALRENIGLSADGPKDLSDVVGLDK